MLVVRSLLLKTLRSLLMGRVRSLLITRLQLLSGDLKAKGGRAVAVGKMSLLLLVHRLHKAKEQDTQAEQQMADNGR